MGNAKLKEDPVDDLAFADELASGSSLMHGQYTIESFLNAGGFGITYSARDSLDRRVVIKECFPGAFCRRSTMLVQARSRAHQNELASIVRLFVQEARSLAKMDHPHIVGVHQVFEENNTAYMALDYVEGRDLLDLIEAGKIDLLPDQVEVILRKVLDAVSFIHKQNILHRDISPDNILLDQDNSPVLIDFGAAREEATKQSRVLSALRVVKDGYSPQEFYIAGSEQGPYSDLYALGATFYHLITGELPPNSQARLAAVAAGDADPYRPLVDRVPRYGKTFLEALDKSLAILPKDRIASAGAWLELLDGKTTKDTMEPVSIAMASPAPNADTKPKSKKGLLLASAAVVAVVAAGVIGSQVDLSSFGTQAPAPEVSASAPITPVQPPAPAVVEPEPVQDAIAALLKAHPSLQDVVEADPTSVPTAAINTSDDLALTAADPAGVEAEGIDPIAVTPVEPFEPPVAEIIEEVVPAPFGVDKVIVADTLADDGALIAPAAQEVAPADQITLVTPVELSPETALAALFDLAAPQGTPLTEIPENAPLPEGTFVAPALAASSTSDEQTLAAAIAAAGALVDSTPGTARPDQFSSVEDDIAFLGSAEVVTPPVEPDNTPDFLKPRPASSVVETVERFDVPGMLSGWGVILPTDASFVPDVFPRILSVNGVTVENSADFNAALRNTFGIPTTAEVDVTVRVATSVETAEDVTLNLPIVHDTVFVSGYGFETVQEVGEWITRVVSVPETGVNSNLQVGDILFGHIASNTRLNDRASFPKTVEAAVKNGDDLTFAVARDGNTWAVALPFSGVALD